MKDNINTNHRWERRDSKQRAKKRFSSDNRKSIRWLYWNSGQKAVKERLHEDESGDVL